MACRFDGGCGPAQHRNRKTWATNLALLGSVSRNPRIGPTSPDDDEISPGWRLSSPIWYRICSACSICIFCIRNWIGFELIRIDGNWIIPDTRLDNFLEFCIRICSGNSVSSSSLAPVLLFLFSRCCCSVTKANPKLAKQTTHGESEWPNKVKAAAEKGWRRKGRERERRQVPQPTPYHLVLWGSKLIIPHR